MVLVDDPPRPLVYAVSGHFAKLKPKLKQFLKRFDDCFPRKDTRAHLPVYVSGQLSDIPEKSVEPIAINAGVPPRTLQEFLSQHHWDEDRARDRLQHIVRDEHAGPHSIGILDETSDVKKGDKTPGVQRQWCGAVGKKENCIVTVHLSLRPRRLPLPCSTASCTCRSPGRRTATAAARPASPTTWSTGPSGRSAWNCTTAPTGNGLHFDWMTFDEGYGSKPEFLRELSARDQQFVGEVPRNFMGWIKAPRVVTRAFRKHGRGRGRKTPRLASGSPPSRRVDAMLDGDGFRNQPWVKWRVKDGHKGPMVWEVKHLRFYPVGAGGLPGEPLHLIVARDVLNPDELKFFVSNAPAGTSVQTMLLVAFSRWRVERCFEDQKSEIGLDQYEGRRYQGLKRHLILSCVSYLFLSRMRQEFGGKNPELTECQVHTAVAALIPFWWLNLSPAEGVAGADLGGDRSGRSAGTPRRGSATPSGHGKGCTRWASNSPSLPRCKWDTT